MALFRLSPSDILRKSIEKRCYCHALCRVIIWFSIATALLYGIYYYLILDFTLNRTKEPVLANLDRVRRSVEKKQAEALKADKGMGCEIPQLDPFAKESTQFDEILPKIKCTGKDWVKCYHSNCKVVDEIKQIVKDIKCKIKDLLYVSDAKYTLGPAKYIKDNDIYELVASDHVRVACKGVSIKGGKWLAWYGNTLGFRSSVQPRDPPPGRENSYNVLILGFDSTALNGFIRLMPRSWKVLTEELGATVMTGYNIVGDATAAALFPILTGHTELELPDARRGKNSKRTVDSFPFIFYKLKEDGYRTAYFEDMPHIGTFQLCFNGWSRQPADHYLRPFMQDIAYKWHGGEKEKYCVGDTPQYKLMMNITEQFLQLNGKRFAFTFIADITHENYNMIQSADEDTADFLRRFVKYSDDTLLIVMGDHGPRYAKVRNTLSGKLGERLPLMALLLPKSLPRERPEALAALKENSKVLTTPHDLHATILDVLGMRQHWNKYKVRGADLYRGLTMLEPIPRNRSCGEAGVEPHWCTCLVRENVSTSDPLYQKTAEALLEYINSLVQEVNDCLLSSDLCQPRTLSSIEWVLRARHNTRLLSFVGSNRITYYNSFNAAIYIDNENYQVKITVGPGVGIYEASMTYIVSEDRFSIKSSDISRTNAYSHEPDCISATHPHLNKYCFCRNAVRPVSTASVSSNVTVSPVTDKAPVTDTRTALT